MSDTLRLPCSVLSSAQFLSSIISNLAVTVVQQLQKNLQELAPPLTPSLSSPDRDGAVQKCLCRPIWWPALGGHTSSVPHWPALGGHTGQGEQGKGSTSRGHWQQLTSLLPGSNQPTHRPVHSTMLQKEKPSKSTWSSLVASFNLCIFWGDCQNVYFCICNIEIVYISLCYRAY